MFKIEITETKVNTKVVRGDWTVIQETDGQKEFGYAPDRAKEVEASRTIYTQEVRTLDLIAVINAVNYIFPAQLTESRSESCVDNLSASEALYGFMAWLTTRDQSVTFGAQHEAGLAAELVTEFCKANNLAAPRDDWTDRLTHPTGVAPDEAPRGPEPL